MNVGRNFFQKYTLQGTNPRGSRAFNQYLEISSISKVGAPLSTFKATLYIYGIRHPVYI